MAAIARDGIYKNPTLFINSGPAEYNLNKLNISPRTLEVLRDGMWAVVNENQGTAHKAFSVSELLNLPIKIY